MLEISIPEVFCCLCQMTTGINRCAEPSISSTHRQFPFSCSKFGEIAEKKTQHFDGFVSDCPLLKVNPYLKSNLCVVLASQKGWSAAFTDVCVYHQTQLFIALVTTWKIIVMVHQKTTRLKMCMKPFLVGHFVKRL